MGQYLHKFNDFSSFSEEYYGEDYHEPWVSYTDEETARTIPTGFTSSVQSSEGMDLSGVFTYYGHAYQYRLDDETQTYKQSTIYYHIWTNGKVYVSTPGGLRPTTGSNSSEIWCPTSTDGELWTPGKMLKDFTADNSRRVSEVYTEEVPENKVAYNKRAVYITWDGTYDTETYPGVDIPNFVVDNDRSTKNIFTQEFDVYVNDQLHPVGLDAEWVDGMMEIIRFGYCTYYSVIYQSDSDGLLYCGTEAECMPN